MCQICYAICQPKVSNGCPPGLSSAWECRLLAAFEPGLWMMIEAFYLIAAPLASLI